METDNGLGESLAQLRPHTPHFHGNQIHFSIQREGAEGILDGLGGVPLKDSL